MKNYKNDSFNLHFQSSAKAKAKNLYLWFYQAFLQQKKHRPNIQFLYGHHLFSDEVQGLKTITRYLQENYKIISYSQAIERLQTGAIDDCYICFSFDDGMLNNQRIADYFAQVGISAMFFINPKVVEEANNEAFTANHSKTRLNKQPLDFMGWKEIEVVQKLGHEIGNHTLSHVDLGENSMTDRLTDEISMAKEMLEKRCGTIEHFAWPYGLRKNITLEAFNTIINTGHTSVASAIRGQHFNKVELDKEFVLRDQLVYKEPLYFFRYFYNMNNQNPVPSNI